MNLFIFKLFIDLLLLVKLIRGHQTSEHSNSTSSKHNNLFATKTSYHQAYYKLLSNENQIKNYKIPNQCKPKFFYLICRHATRYPSKKKIGKMKEQMYLFKEKLINNDDVPSDLKERFKKWELRMQSDDDNRISDTGIIETKEFANRIKKDYPQFFDKDKIDLKLYTTFKTRTNETAFAFFQEVFFKNETYNPNIKQHLVFHSDCKDILKKNGVNLHDPKAVDDLIASDVVNRMRTKIAKRIGIDNDQFNFKNLKIIYVTCSFEYAIFNDTLWCNLFDKEDFQLMEYIIDLQSYLIGGHGRQINSRMACPVLVDLIQHLNETTKLIKRDDKLITSLQFSHSGIFKRIYAMFGLFKEFGSSHCRSSFQCFNEWRSSLILPFLANINFLMYDCGSVNGSDYRLITKIQEHFVKIDGCNDFLCPLDDFFRRYQSEAKKCDLKEICTI